MKRWQTLLAGPAPFKRAFQERFKRVRVVDVREGLKRVRVVERVVHRAYRGSTPFMQNFAPPCVNWTTVSEG